MELWHGICKSLGMNKTKFISTILLATAFSFAAGESSAPESYVPTPAEKQEFSKETPGLSQQERADWQRMREERKQAREQILSKLREAPPSERSEMRQNGLKNRDERPRFEGEFPKNQPREREMFDPNRGSGRPDFNDREPMGDRPNPPPKGGKPMGR
jgi:hypothetical protein